MAIKCCHKCVPPERYPGCHATCGKYATAKEKHDAEREAEKKKRQISDGVYAQRSSSIGKAIRNHGKKR